MSWDYNISKDGGNQLRWLVDSSDGSGESLAQILEQIQSCCREVIRRMTDADDEISAGGFEDLLELMGGEAELCRERDLATIRSFGYDSMEALVDSRLEEFYDCCDSARVWLGIGLEAPSDERKPAETPTMGGMTM